MAETTIHMDDDGFVSRASTPSGGLTIENNGTALPERSQLNIVGKNVFSTDANENKILLFQELPKDMRFEFNNHALLDNVWLHTDGYWYIVGNVYRGDSENPYVYVDNLRVVKTQDWGTFTTVFEAARGTNNRSAEYPRLVVDADGNVIVVARKDASAPNAITCFFYNASNQSVTLTDVQLSIATTSFSRLDSIAIKADGTVGVAGFAWEPGYFDKLFYVERSPGINGVWSAKDSIGGNPLRAIVSSSCIHLFYGSDGEPRIVFLNNAAASSSKMSVAKKQAGTWTVYESTVTTAYQASMDSNNNIYIATAGNTLTIFWNSSNSFISSTSTGLTPYQVTCTNNAIYAANPTGNTGLTLSTASTGCWAVSKLTSNSVLDSLRYRKPSINLLANHAIPAVSMPYFILYNRQRLDNAYALMFRMDGSMFMEAVSW